MNKSRGLLMSAALTALTTTIFTSRATSTANAQATAAPAQGKKPNIVFILVDNVGWGNFGVYGGTIPTPRIDKLASEGIRFNNYNVEVQCTPSRSAIMTGRHPVRSGTYDIEEHFTVKSVAVTSHGNRGRIRLLV